MADKAVRFQEQEQDASTLRALEIRQKENERKITNLIAAIEDGVNTPTTKSRLIELEAEKANIEKGIARELISAPTLTRDQIIYFLERCRNGNKEDENYRIMLIDMFLNSVFLYDDDKLVLVMNCSGEDCKITLPIMEKAVNPHETDSSLFEPSSAPNGAILNFFTLCFFKKVVAVALRIHR